VGGGGGLCGASFLLCNGLVKFGGVTMPKCEKAWGI